MAGLAFRIPEPEYMTEEEEFCYALADYSVPHEALAREIVFTVDRPSVRALDIGCGPGDVLLRLRNHAPNWTLFGADISARMLTIARDAAQTRLAPHHQGINWILTNGRSLGFEDGFFDVILSNSVLHHVADADQFWREIGRLAVDGCHIFVRDLRRPANEEEARRKAIIVSCLMTGAVGLSRISNDEAFATEILDTVKDFVGHFATNSK